MPFAIPIVIIVAIIIVLFLPSCVEGYYGGGLKQGQGQDQDYATCQFTSLIHAVVVNPKMNRIVCMVLRNRIERGEYYWSEIHHLLCNLPLDVQRRIRDTRQFYFPKDVYPRKTLRQITTNLWREGFRPKFPNRQGVTEYADTSFIFIEVILPSLFTSDDTHITDQLKSVTDFNYRKDYKIGLNPAYSMSWLHVGRPKHSEQYLNIRFIYWLINMINIPYEMAILSFNRNAGVSGHATCLTYNPEIGYVYYDDAGYAYNNRYRSMVLLDLMAWYCYNMNKKSEDYAN